MQEQPLETQITEDILHCREIFDNVQDMIVMVEPECLRFVYLNPAACDCLGYELGELLQMTMGQICPVLPESEFRHQISLLQAQALPRAALETVMRRKDGTDFLVGMRIHPAKNHGGEHRIVATLRRQDAYRCNGKLLPTDLAKGLAGKPEQMQLEEAVQLIALMDLYSSESMIVTDDYGVIVNVNRAFTAVTGYAAAEVIGKNARLLHSGRHDQAFYRAMWNDISTTGRWQGEIWNRRKNGELYLEWITINTLCNTEGEVRHVGLFSDITRIKTSEALIWQQANFDMLTGLPNRHMFQSRLDLEIKKARQDQSSMAVLFVDIDNFQEVNDTLGHNLGDQLLVEAARRVRTCLSEADAVARISGDEFAVVVSDLSDAGSVETIVQQIMDAMSAVFQLGAEKSYVSVSIGISLYPEDAVNAENLLKNAGQAMYAAKSQGRNNFCYFTASMQQSAKNKRRLVNELREALEQEQFRLFYQPIVTLSNGALHKAEALIRWQHPSRGLISPAEFIPVAEEIGLITAIGDWVFREAATKAALWRSMYYAKFQISINVSPVQFRHFGANFEAWFQHLDQLELSGQSLVVEITEGLLLDVHASVTHQLLAFRDAGIRVSLDDFGTGYSALSYLKKFDIDYLKIDQSFVRDLSQDANDMALCEAIIVMAHKLGLKVIAEGIETEAQRRLLTGVGCDYGQGYLFSPPVSAEAFERRLKMPVSW